MQPCVVQDYHLVILPRRLITVELHYALAPKKKARKMRAFMVSSLFG